MQTIPRLNVTFDGDKALDYVIIASANMSCIVKSPPAIVGETSAFSLPAFFLSPETAHSRRCGSTIKLKMSENVHYIVAGCRQL